jgi:hypothetical protein
MLYSKFIPFLILFLPSAWFVISLICLFKKKFKLLFANIALFMIYKWGAEYYNQVTEEHDKYMFLSFKILLALNSIHLIVLTSIYIYKKFYKKRVLAEHSNTTHL